MKCLKAPQPPVLPRQSLPSQWPDSALVRSSSKALVGPNLADTLYFAGRPRGLGKVQFSLKGHNRRSSDVVTARKPLPDPAIKRVEQLSRKRLNGLETPRNPILQTEPSFDRVKSLKCLSTPSASQSTQSSSSLSQSRSSLYDKRNFSSVFSSAPASRATSKSQRLSSTAALIQYRYAPKYREQKVTGKPQNVPLEDWGFWH